MPPRPSPPRLYLRKRRDGANTWIILDCGQQISTGALADDRRAAEEALENYLGRKHRPSFGDGHPTRVAVADVLSAYAEKHGPTTARPDLIAGAVLKWATILKVAWWRLSYRKAARIISHGAAANGMRARRSKAS